MEMIPVFSDYRLGSVDIRPFVLTPSAASEAPTSITITTTARYDSGNDTELLLELLLLDVAELELVVPLFEADVLTLATGAICVHAVPLISEPSIVGAAGMFVHF